MNTDELIKKVKLTDEERNNIANSIPVEEYATSIQYWEAIIEAELEAQLRKVLSLVVKEGEVCPGCHGMKGFVSTTPASPNSSLPGWSDCLICHGTGRTEPKTIRDLINENL